MDARRTFGRRAASPPPFPRRAIPAPVLAPVLQAEPAFSSSAPGGAPPSVEDEIAAWKAERGAVVPFPWRQVSLMAGLCFGIASFVLPESINDTLQWPLYALAGASFYMGLRKRKAKNSPFP